MKKETTKQQEPSRVVWESLEQWARTQIQSWLQDLLEAEVTEFLGREKSERRKPVDSFALPRFFHPAFITTVILKYSTST